MMRVDFSKVGAACEQYPLAENFRPSYGTAGFRAEASLLPGVLFRCGVLTALRVLATGKTCGIVVTASHNPVNDNGAKIVDFNGEMLDQSWEGFATELANADTPAGLVSACEKIGGIAGLGALKKGMEVIMGYDTRPSSPKLAEAAKAGIASLGVPIAEGDGAQSTAQVHFRVWRRYHDLEHDEFQWFKYLAGGYMRMARGTNGVGLGNLIVDCANGIGGDKLKQLCECPGAAPQGYKFELRNTGDGELNLDCGADYVQKESGLPLGFKDIAEWQRCASLDGDADRVVYFTNVGGKRVLLDGDKIAALAAIHVKELLSISKKWEDSITVGVVQTAYANGASTRFLKETLEIPVTFTPTGVKYLHPEAKKYDIGIYFEANGHGTVLVKESLIEKFRELEDKEQGAFEFLALSETMNQAVGDGISGILMVEAILRRKRWKLDDWMKIYTDLPSKQLKVKVSDRTVIKTINAETQCQEPKGLQDMIDKAVRKYSQGRAFVRPSGTEDIVRVYAEADNETNMEKLANEVASAVHKLAGGLGKNTFES